MRSTIVAAACAAIVAFGASAEECTFCTVNVRLNEALVACLTSRFDREIAVFQASDAGFTTVNLADCEGDSGNRGSGVLPTNLRRERLDTSFVITETGLTCLKAQLDVAVRPVEPSRVFEIVETC